MKTKIPPHLLQLRTTVRITRTRLASLSEAPPEVTLATLREIREALRDLTVAHQVCLEAAAEQRSVKPKVDTSSGRQVSFGSMSFGGMMANMGDSEEDYAYPMHKSSRNNAAHSEVLASLQGLTRAESDVFYPSSRSEIPDREGFGMAMIKQITGAIEKQTQGPPVDPVLNTLKRVKAAKDAGMDPATLAALEDEARATLRVSLDLPPEPPRLTGPTSAPTLGVDAAASLNEAEEQAKAKEQDFLVEEQAKGLYNSWADRPGWKPWVERGNSLMQDSARDEVRRSKRIVSDGASVTAPWGPGWPTDILTNPTTSPEPRS